jgi:hypothetical protein
MSRIPDALSMAVLLVLSVLLWLPRLRGPIDLRYDAGVYYITGTALAEGKGYRLLNEPNGPGRADGAQAVQYPPGLPALVALHQLALGSSDPAVVGPWLRRSYCLIFLAYVQAVYWVGRGQLAPPYALLAALITALYLHTLFLSDLLFADIPFALATALFALSARRSDRPGWFALTALLGVAAYLLRTAGMALLVAWAAEAAFRRKGKQLALRAAVALAPVLAWQGYLSHVTSGEEYRHPAYPYQRAAYLCYNVTYAENILQWVDPFLPERGRATPGDLVRRVLTHLAAMPAHLGEAVTADRRFWELLLRLGHERLGTPLPPPWVLSIPLTFFGCLTLAGAGVLLVRRQWFIPLYLALSVGLTCLTPWPEQFARYLTPLTPFLAVALLRLLAGFRAYSSCWPARWQRVVLAAIALTVSVPLGTEVLTTVGMFKSRYEKGAAGVPLFFYDRAWADYDAALAWLKGEADPGDVVATGAPHWTYLKTGLKAVIPPPETDPDKGQELLEAAGVRYVIVDEMEFLDVTRKYTAPTIRAHPRRWREVYRPPGGDTRVYRRVGRGRG